MIRAITHPLIHPVFFTLGVFISVCPLLKIEIQAEVPVTDSKTKSFDIFPIIMYDMDIGLGLGGRALLKNSWKKQESLDLILFASSKGEQLYFFQFSIPDAELRHRKSYFLAYDFMIEWDKLLRSNYFGLGNSSPDNDFHFPREYFKIEQIFSHTFSPIVISEGGLTLVHHTVYNYDESWNTIRDSGCGGKPHCLTFWKPAPGYPR